MDVVVGTMLSCVIIVAAVANAANAVRSHRSRRVLAVDRDSPSAARPASTPRANRRVPVHLPT